MEAADAEAGDGAGAASPPESGGTAEPLSLELPPLLADRYRLYEKLGMGSYGDVFSGADVQTGEPVAVKLEHVQCPRPSLWHEAHVLSDLERAGGAFPRVHFAGCVGDLNALVMDLLGWSLADAREARPELFDGATVLAVGAQLVELLERMHACGYLHRDVKGGNVLLDRGTASRLHLVDMGLARRLGGADGGPSGERPAGLGPTGTPKYVSVAVHEGAEPARRDDLESALYTLASLGPAGLPWERLEAPSRERYCELALEQKRAAGGERLFAGLPRELADCLAHVRSLGADERPDYDLLRRHLRAAADRLGAGLELRSLSALAGPPPPARLPRELHGPQGPPPAVAFALQRLYLHPGAADPSFQQPTFTRGLPRPGPPPPPAGPAAPPAPPRLLPRPALEPGGCSAAAQVAVVLHGPGRLIAAGDFARAAARLWGAVAGPRPPPGGTLLYRSPVTGAWEPLPGPAALPYSPHHVYEFAYGMEDEGGEGAREGEDPEELGGLADF